MSESTGPQQVPTDQYVITNYQGMFPPGTSVETKPAVVPYLSGTVTGMVVGTNAMAVKLCGDTGNITIHISCRALQLRGVEEFNRV